ncbi:unnamed protein product [marine sediment metagenome]|uniref:Uncharacterized protein n=1 Tax=marine sediment metagenome TaxID=412755 RepID=X0Z0L8_9ZZZZ
MPNGEYEEQFNKKLAEWEAQTKLYVEQTITAQTRLEDLTKQLTEASTQFIPPSAPPKMIGPVEFISPAMSELLKKAEYAVATAPEIQLIKDDITRVSAELERYDFFARLYNEVPAAIAAGAVYGADGVLTKLIPPGDLTAAELEEVRTTISEMAAIITGKRAEAEPGFAEAEGLPEEVAYPELVAPSIPSISPSGCQE